MKAPDKLFIKPEQIKVEMIPGGELPNVGIQYIRKDLVDEKIKTAEETIQLAEDHAYFAGKEKLREELLEWAKEMKEQVSIGLNAYDMGEENGKAEILNKLIDKLHEM